MVRTALVALPHTWARSSTRSARRVCGHPATGTPGQLRDLHSCLMSGSSWSSCMATMGEEGSMLGGKSTVWAA